MTYKTILEVIHNWAYEYSVASYNHGMTNQSFEVLAELIEMMYINTRSEKEEMIDRILLDDKFSEEF